MAFNGTEGEFISLGEAADMTKAWRTGDFGPGDAVFYGRERLEELLDQEGVMGIRMYFAVNEKNEKTLVLVGATENEDDLHNGLILDRGPICPSTCSTSNPLNS